MNEQQPSQPDKKHENSNPPPEAFTAEEEIVIKANEIFQGAKEILIEHGDEVYRLSITRNNKLILNSYY